MLFGIAAAVVVRLATHSNGWAGTAVASSWIGSVFVTSLAIGRVETGRWGRAVAASVGLDAAQERVLIGTAKSLFLPVIGTKEWLRVVRRLTAAR